ncbi:autotransporter domain-containing protein [Neptunomonas sp.]|uniref:autotransporter domain-containing protein n=1 Tax=Neptunomonas sp. TaxID=1971898 RepID=UPI0025D49440|nr:autotransporter domain-containing protein [Neptunomonas sp.]
MIKPAALLSLVKASGPLKYFTLLILLQCLVSKALLAASITPTSLDFGEVVVGQSPKLITINVLFDSTDAGSDLFIGSPNSPFLISTNNCPSFVSTTNASCDVQVAFEPTANGSYPSSFDINVGNTATEISLTGTASTKSTTDLVKDELIKFSNGNPNIIATSEAISTACVSGNITAALQRDCNSLVQSAFDGNAATSTALAQITPETATKANQTTQKGGATQTSNINSRISALRNGAFGISLTGLNLQTEDQNMPIGQLAQTPLRMKGGGASADDSILFGQKLGAFITGTISTGEKEESSLESGLDFDTYGITAGVDYRISDQFFLGIALGYMNTDTNFNNSKTELDTRGYSLSTYGSYYTTRGYYVDFSATYGKNNFDQKRHISYQLDNTVNVNQVFTADYSGDVYSLVLGLGRDYNKGAWSFSPKVDLEYTRANANQITEQSSAPTALGSGWGTQIESTDQKWLTLQVGGKVSYAQSTSWGVLIPYAELGLLHEFKQDSQTISGSFSGDFASNQLQITTDNPDRNYMTLSIGTSVQLKHGASGFVSYSTLLSNNVWSENTIRLGMRAEF